MKSCITDANTTDVSRIFVPNILFLFLFPNIFFPDI